MVRTEQVNSATQKMGPQAPPTPDLLELPTTPAVRLQGVSRQRRERRVAYET